MNREALPAELAARYARAVDDREFAAMESIMWPEFTQQGPGFRAESLAVFVANLEFLRQFDRTFHLLGQVTGEWQDNRYRGETWCVASHFYQREDRPLCYDMYIRYQDRFTREGGVWKLAERQLIVDRTEGEDIG